jgi:hypothetical protein
MNDLCKSHRGMLNNFRREHDPEEIVRLESRMRVSV